LNRGERRDRGGFLEETHKSRSDLETFRLRFDINPLPSYLCVLRELCGEKFLIRNPQSEIRNGRIPHENQDSKY
jgi:hypothetical protein